jgi:hypothetical protein
MILLNLVPNGNMVSFDKTKWSFCDGLLRNTNLRKNIKINPNRCILKAFISMMHTWNKTSSIYGLIVK